MSTRFSRAMAMLLVVFLAGMALLFAAVSFSDNADRRAPEILVMQLIALGGLSWLMLRGPVGRAIANMLEGSSLPDGDAAQLIDDLQHRVAQLEQRGMHSGEVEQAYQRLSEMESRLDFTERLLTRGGIELPLHRGEQS